MFDSIYGNDQVKSRMIVIPFAGGSSQSFSKWHAMLKNDVDIEVLDYPGHGIRVREKLVSDFRKLIEDMERQLISIANQPVILYGHSMGGVVSAYVAAECYRRYGMIFKGIIISSCLSPKKLGDKQYVELTYEQLEQYLITERNVPDYIIKTKEFKKYIMPAIMNDFRLLREFKYQELQLPPCPIHCIYAEQDYDIDIETMKNWQDCCLSPIVWHKIRGSHFYFEEYPKEAFELIRNIVVCL